MALTASGFLGLLGGLVTPKRVRLALLLALRLAEFLAQAFDFVLEFGEATVSLLTAEAGGANGSHGELLTICSEGEAKREMLDPRCTYIIPAATRGAG